MLIKQDELLYTHFKNYHVQNKNFYVIKFLGEKTLFFTKELSNYRLYFCRTSKIN